ncbi:MAG: hypothetical protein KFW07_03145 [Mycoplasmataceae bacterium]|nr:hypothetical protein [Mycoplasmataceae bacterium]
MKNNNWGNPFNANRQAKISEGVNQTIHSDIFFKNELSEFGVMNILLRELSGTFSFNENCPEWLLNIENTFWWNLMFYGRVGILQYAENKFIVVNVNNVLTSYQKIKEVWCSPARIQFEQQSANVDPKQQKQYVLRDMNKIVVINNDVTSEFFQLKFGWFINNFLSIHKKYFLGLQIKQKKMGIYFNTKTSSIITALENSFSDDKPYITLQAPKVENDITKSATKAMESNFVIEQFNFPSDGYIGLEEVIKYWKYGKDILGMNENINDNKERVISTEVEDSKENTILMEVSSMRNFKIFSREMKQKFGIEVKVEKTTDKMKKNENSKQAFSKLGEKIEKE